MKDIKSMAVLVACVMVGIFAYNKVSAKLSNS